MATKTVIYKNDRILVDDTSALGVGGEATVVLHKGVALKVYHQPSKARSNKLLDFIKAGSSIKLPTNIAFPIDVILDEKSKDIVGFSMPLAKGKEAINLSNKQFRKTEQITPNDIIAFFENSKITMDAIHSVPEFFIGDNNDLNVLFTPKFESIYIDVDSFQLGKWPCAVGTDTYLDPNLYGLNLSDKPYFSKESDWYSFAVMLFKCLLLAHPYGGTHASFDSIIERAKRKIYIMDSSVTYPRISNKPETISPELLDIFDKIFRLGERVDIPVALLTAHKNQFEKCNQCNGWFYKGRGKCPVCFVTTVQPAPLITHIVVSHKIDDDRCLSETIFQTEGSILYSKVLEDNRIIIVEYSANQTKVHEITEKTRYTHKIWDGHKRDVVFDFFKNYLVVGTNELMIVELVGNQIKPIGKTMTLQFDHKNMIGCSGLKLYRLTDQALIATEVVHGNLSDTVVMQTLQNQTWFAVGVSGLGILFYRIFQQYYFVVFSNKGRYETAIPSIQGQLIEYCAEISKNTVLFLFKTLDKGRTYSYYYLIDDEGKILDSKKEESISSPFLKTIEGKILLGTSIVHPSDAGIVIEHKGAFSLKKATEKFVDSGCSLSLYKDGILAVSEHDAKFLRLIKQ
jgi:serine/threonine protein kinase